jgi:hypothetical protein
MTDINISLQLADSLDCFDEFDFFDKSKRPKERRKAIRYIREDIDVIIVRGLPLSFYINKTAKLMDINSKGMLVDSKLLSLNKSYEFILLFTTGIKFNVKGRVVNHSILSPINQHELKYLCGIKFDRFYDELGDYLLKTQDKLIIK